MLSVGDNYQVTIKDTNIFGNGFCVIDDTSVFVEGALSGEICDIEITSFHSYYAYAKIKKLIKASCERVTPKCKHYNDCGGCSFLHTSQEFENEVKKHYVKHAFQAQGIVASVENVQCFNQEYYRNKIVLFSLNHSITSTFDNFYLLLIAAYGQFGVIFAFFNIKNFYVI